MPQDSVHAIAQTRDGFLWLGTEEGLARFDGRQFRIYDRRNSKDLASDYIQALCASRDGSLWIGTDSGLTHYFPDSLTASSRSAGTFSTLTAKNGLAADDVRAIDETEDGTLWVGTGAGLLRMRAGKIDTWTTAQKLAGNAVNAIAEDSRGAIWVATDGGVSRLNNGHVTTWTTAQGLPASRAVALSIEPDDSVWVAILGHGLVQIHAGHIVPAPFKLPWQEINSLLRDRDGALWMEFDRHGVGRLFQDKLSLYNNGDGLPSDRSTRALFEDREGDLWIGMLDAGVVELRDGKFTVYGKPEGLPGNYIGNLLQARDGSMWFGSDSNGLTHLLPDGQVEQWNHTHGLPDEAVFSLLQARDGSLWVGYRRGALAHIVNRNVTVFRDPAAPESSVNALLQDREGRLWIGYFGKGLATFGDGHFQHFSNTERIPAMAQAPDGALWVATDGEGVERIYRGLTTHFTTANGLPSDHAMCIYADANGDVWVGTASGGLSRIRGNQVASWGPEQGLTNATVGSVIADNQGDIWIGGDSGIERIARHELDEWQSNRGQMLHPVVFGTADGLRSRETVYGSMPSSWRDRNGRLWFATIMGAAEVDPAHLRLNDVIPPVWIDRAIVNSKSIAPNNGSRFALGSGNIEFLFTAPTFVAPQNESFRYRLIGFDRDWIAAGNRRHAWYTNLPPGRYTFAVQARNSDGIWNTAGASFSFVFLPPLSRTPLAYVLYGIVALVLAWFAIRFRTGTLIRRQEELKRIVAERTEQLETEKQALGAARKELQARATYDSLTGLLNRGAILERLEHEVSRAMRDDTPIGLIIADLDFFKKINDTYGHVCGDEVIRETARRLRTALRSYDLAGRYGGEEFLIVLPGWDSAASPDRVSELLEAIRSRPYPVSGRELRITCSMGAATFRPSKGDTDILEMLRKSDAELYLAKQQGRDRACIASLGDSVVHLR